MLSLQISPLLSLKDFIENPLNIFDSGRIDEVILSLNSVHLFSFCPSVIAT